MTTRSIYWGSKTILAIAIDVGTTFRQENKQSNSKVPTVLFYPNNGDPVVCGAEAKRLRSRKGIKTEWFKLNLRPASMKIDAPKVHLPPGRDVVDVFGDFLKYMYDCVGDQIRKQHSGGDDLWSSLKGTAQFVLRAKAVAHGGVAFYLDRNVTERTMRHTYGVSLRPWFDPSDPEHQARSHMADKHPISGITYLDGGFFPLVKKGQVVNVDSVYRKSARSMGYRAPEMHTWVQSIKRYNGTQDNITFIDMDPSAFADIGWFSCEIPASAMTREAGEYGTYYVAEFEVVIALGTVEIKAHVEWEENGKKKKTPANSMWEDYY
ncbi:hypothetical protein M407DRAFT_232728 [Tulasnella calospora MUT 4182]|uniref:Uncharacterized protein n=1 Tax=Tulasnella calospora MUT 4182 TaxID=1051891 RepID=A0A0C3QJV3_9AGAM|nr:hypothetical protein M407DRAFT_232728 [Tulasnella calospora MUT 4182]